MKYLDELLDEKLVQKIRSEEKELYREIIKRYEGKLLRYAGYLVRDEDKAADVVQETFIKAYKNLNGFNLNKKFSSWIYRIAHNEAMNVINKHRKTALLNEEIDLNSGIDLEDDLIKKELKEHAHYCLDQMSVIYSEPLTLYFLESRSYEEIGDILRIPMGTVAVRISRAKAIMKKICKKR